jgi:hypothetical protein
MVGVLIVVGISFQFGATLNASGDEVLAEPYSTLAVVGVMLFVSGYQVGFGPIAWLLISEIFPLAYRSQAMSIAVLLNFGTNLLVAVTFLSFSNLVGPFVSYYIYAGIAAFAFIFVYKFLPETKGQTLEQIQKSMKMNLGF